MLKELLFIATLLLAAYGLACVLSAIVLWFTAPIKGKPYFMLIQLRPEDAPHFSALSVRERLNNSGLHRSTTVLALDCGLDENQRNAAKKHCHSADIQMIQISELSLLLKDNSLQPKTDKAQ